MASYHFNVSPIQRSKGRSATAAAAYRAGEKIHDERTGQTHDYSNRRGVVDAELFLPNGNTADRAAFWNKIEQHHKRGDAVLAREIDLALPHELDEETRKKLAYDFAQHIADRYGVAADVAIHLPSEKGDERNHHAHILLSACHVSPEGELGKKAVELDPIHCARHKLENFADRERETWATMANRELERAGLDVRIDHRTLEAQGIDREPTEHLGVTVTAMERRGIDTDRAAAAHEITADREEVARLKAELAEVMEQYHEAEADRVKQWEDDLAKAAIEQAEAEEKQKREEAAKKRALEEEEERKKKAAPEFTPPPFARTTSQAYRAEVEQEKDERARQRATPQPTLTPGAEGQAGALNYLRAREQARQEQQQKKAGQWQEANQEEKRQEKAKAKTESTLERYLSGDSARRDMWKAEIERQEREAERQRENEREHDRGGGRERER